jgi:hypothetical protein
MNNNKTDLIEKFFSTTLLNKEEFIMAYQIVIAKLNKSAKGRTFLKLAKKYPNNKEFEMVEKQGREIRSGGAK